VGKADQEPDFNPDQLPVDKSAKKKIFEKKITDTFQILLTINLTDPEVQRSVAK